MARVLIDQDITPTDHLLEQLDDSWEATVGVESDEETLRDTISDYDIALVTSRVPLTRDVLDRASRLKLVGKLGTGIDSVNVEAARDNEIAVTHTPGHNALSVAEHTLCLTLATARRLRTARNLVEDGRWRDEYTLGTSISGSTLGIVGFGNVGKRVGKLLFGFDVDVLTYDPYVPITDTELVGAEESGLDTLLSESDFVVLTAELTEETRGMIGQRELSLMDSSAFLINTARGPIVREDALVGALREGGIAGAGLDVYSSEPLESESPLLDLENVVTTPHIAAMTTECRQDNIDRLVTNVTRLFAGRSVPDRYVAART